MRSSEQSKWASRLGFMVSSWPFGVQAKYADWGADAPNQDRKPLRRARRCAKESESARSLGLQRREAFGEAVESDRNADPLFGRLEDDEGCRLARLQGVEQLLLQNHFCIAAILEAAHEIRTSDILAVDIETEPVGQKHP